MFVGRKRELALLEDAFSSSRFEFIVVYGRRRVGKTALLNEFMGQKKAVYMTGVENDADINLHSLSAAISDIYPELPAETFGSFRAALEFLFRKSAEEKILLIIDEYPYVARSDKSLASVIQMLIDRYRGKSQLKLILCGSSMSFMEDEVLAYKAPLYGRRTGQIRLRPFEFRDARLFVPQMEPAEQLTVYGATGGIPSYLLEFDDSAGLYENLRRTFLSPGSVLYAEPESVLRQELREPAGYSAILAAIASGASRFSEIISRAHMSQSAGDAHLRRLMELELVSRRTPFNASNAKKSVYGISDGAFRFWYRFVLPNVSLIERGSGARVMENISGQIPDFTARTFEKVCAEYLWHLADEGRSPVDFRDLGVWWGTDPVTRRAEEIDIVGAGSESILTAECKWRMEPVNETVLRTLRACTSLISGSARPHMYLFARNGFTEGCLQDAALAGNVSAVTFPELVSEL